MTGPYAQYAKKYRELGWLGTLPLPPGLKHPPPKGFTGSGRPHPTNNQVLAWVRGKDSDHAYSPDGNIALRLGEVPDAYLGERELPVIYGGNNVDGWELIGIDVDDYGDKKNGRTELRELEAELGPLPATAMSSARWGIWSEHRSAIRVFLVPKGYRYMGKISPSIEVIQKRHRFMVAHPSTNPDADGALYEWRWGATNHGVDDGGDPRYGALAHFEGGIPRFDDTAATPEEHDVAVLPVAWFVHMSRGGTIETDDPISNLSDDELFEWAQTLDYEDDPCERMQRCVAECLERIDNSDSSHDKIIYAHWRIFNMAAEGHKGLKWALDTVHTRWRKHVIDNRGDLEAALGELNRSALNALDKIQPLYDGLGRPSDMCSVNAEDYDTDGWATRFEQTRTAAERQAIEDGDFGGLGPVVGRMEVLQPKPANEYGQHDDGNGQHFIDIYGANVKYVDGRDSWVVWDGQRWHRDLNNRYSGLAYRRVRINQETYGKELLARGKEEDDKALIAQGKSWLQWSRRSGNVAPINSALESAIRLYVDGPHGEEPVSVKATVFDSRPDLLGCENGVLELTPDPDIRKPRKEDYVTFNTHVPYVPWRTLANSEGETFEGYMLWLEYLNTFLPDPELQRYVQKVMGHLIVGENPEKRIVFLFGPHDTGKSTMISALKSALGDYYGTVDISLFKPKDLNPGLIRACPLRVTGMSEVDAGTMDAATVKRLTGNDSVMAEAKYSNDIFEGRPQFTTVVAANNPPNIKHADEALEERLLVLPFTTSIDRSHRRYERQNQIESHSGVAVLSWLVEGWRMYCAEGLDNAPKAVQKLQRDMVAGMNDTQTFIAEHLIKAGDSEEGLRALARAKERAKSKGRMLIQADLELDWTPTVANVYEMYVRWCNANGVQPVSRVELTKDIGLGKPFVRKVNGKPARCYWGARLRTFEVVRGSGWRVK